MSEIDLKRAERDAQDELQAEDYRKAINEAKERLRAKRELGLKRFIPIITISWRT